MSPDMSFYMSEQGTPDEPRATSGGTKTSKSDKEEMGPNTKEMLPVRPVLSSVDTESHGQPPIGLEPTTCGLQNRCSTD